jgi:hypothetical protein
MNSDEWFRLLEATLLFLGIVIVCALAGEFL